ncbi:MAG: polysaccharide lyase family 8 super-sandwich domain-containing protein [Paludibacter sp.]|nr:polysaccharide lyase family 8 super-sandwich domain-containing protein [Paludibacter sp.]
MKRNLIFVFLLTFYSLNSNADNQLVQQLKDRIIELNRTPFFQTNDHYNLASVISNKGNTTDLSLRELYWNTFQQNSDLDKFIKTQQPDGSWLDIDYTDSARSSWGPTNHVSRILYLSRAYITPNSKFYQQKYVSEVIHRGLNYWFTVKPVCPNWWYNQIGVPRFMGLIFIFIENELTQKEKTKAVTVMNNSGFRMTGQNKVWLAGNVMLKALLINDEKLALRARDSIASEIFVTSKEGIQADYSFHQHGPQQQFGNYGLAFISSMAYYTNVFGGSSLAFSPDQMGILRNYILDGENWIVWKGAMDVSACNRQMFKQAQVGKAMALCVAVSQFKQVDTVYAEKYNDFLKRNLKPEGLIENPMAKHFWRSDLTVFRGSRSYVSVRACSPRVKGTEFTNNENKKGHFISDGCTIFMRNGDEYKDIFPVWDWNKLPGVTAPLIDPVKANTKDDDCHNPNPFVGGLAHTGNGLSTFHLNRNGIDAKKSWFYLNSVFVCLGTDIKANKGKEIVTAVNQCNQKGKAIITFRESKAISVTDTLIYSTSVQSVWHDSIGYYFPEQSAISLSVNKQNGTWHDIADPYSTDLISGNVFKLWIDHGVDAKIPAYEYLVLPSVSSKQLTDYIKNPNVVILANSKTIQAVKLKDNTLFQFVFHKPARINTYSDTEFIETETPGLIMIERNGTTNLTITVVDPTQLQKTFKLMVSGRYVSKYATYNRVKNQTELVIPLPQEVYAGSAVTVELKQKIQK